VALAKAEIIRAFEDDYLFELDQSAAGWQRLSISWPKCTRRILSSALVNAPVQGQGDPVIDAKTRAVIFGLLVIIAILAAVWAEPYIW
jgi:hypothetical protein